MTLRRILLWSVVGGVLGGGTISCDLFKTRSPVQPSPPTAGCHPLTSGYLAAVLNVEDFYGRLSGTTCYASTIDAAFAFHPDAQDSSQALPDTPYIAWDDSIETRVNSNIASVEHFISVSFTREYASPLISTDQNTQVRFYEYLLRLFLQGQSDTIRFTGLSDLTIHRGTDGQWRITQWVDHRGSVSDSTWGLLRRTYRF